MPVSDSMRGATLLSSIASYRSMIWEAMTTPLGLSLLGLVVAIGLVLVVVWLSRRGGRAVARVPAPYLAALHAWLGGRHGRAEVELRRVLADNPHHVDAALLLGNLYRHQGRHRLALGIHRELEIRRGLTRRQRIDVLAALLADAMAMGMQSDRLEPLAEALLELAPAHPMRLEVCVESARRKGDVRAALQLIETAERHRQAMEGQLDTVGEGRAAVEARLSLFLCREGDALRSAGDLKEARRFYRRALRHDESHAAPYLGLAALAGDRGRDGEALRWYQRAVEHAAPELVISGLEKLATPAAEDLIRDLATSGLEGDPARHPLRRALIRQHQRGGDSQAALDEVRAAVNGGDCSVATLRLGVDLARQAGSSDAALELLLSALPDGTNEWRCHRCGALMDDHEWRCAECGGWDVLSPAGMDRREWPAGASR